MLIANAIHINKLRLPFTYCYLSNLRKLLAAPHGEKVNKSSISLLSTSTDEVSMDEDCASEKFDHVPVMVHEVLDKLQPENGKVILDMTFGAGGHSRELLKNAPGLRLLCLDRDPVAYGRAQDLSKTHTHITPLHGKFSQVHHLLHTHGYDRNSLDGVLLDVGASSLQFDDTSTGFSLSRDGPLDMRMDRGCTDGITAEDVVNNLDEGDLYKILKRYGEEKRAKVIARAIVDSRYAFGRIKTTKQLANIVASVFTGATERDKLFRHAHVATRTFQAIRIFVNNELNELYNGLNIVHQLLKPEAPCVAIAFHSLEDRIIKRTFHGIDMDTKLNMGVTQQCRVGNMMYGVEEMREILHNDWKPIVRGVILPTEAEIVDNPRARSAKLRAAWKVE